MSRFDRIVVIASFRDLHTAQLAKVILESDGILARLDNEFMVGAEWWLSNAVGGVKVMVMQKEAFKARQLLRASTESEDFKVNIIEADAAESRASCPHCGSHNIIQKKFSKRKY